MKLLRNCLDLGTSEKAGPGFSKLLSMPFFLFILKERAVCDIFPQIPCITAWTVIPHW